MAFDNVELTLPVGRFAGTIQHQTTILVGDNGSEVRNVDWDDPLLLFEISSSVIRTEADLQTLIRFNRARKGAGRGFLVKDWSDYQATNEAIGTRTGTGAQTFQLIKTYSDAGNAAIREIYKPKSGTVTIYDNSTPLVAGTDYTLSFTTGILTILASHVTSGHALSWDGQFYVPVRFLEDKLKTDLLLYKISSGMAQASNVLLIETRDFS
jgi:uncharacterized protein (TIGR02217 family)